MSSRKKINFAKHILVFMISLAIFLAGLSVGYLTTAERLKSISDIENNLRLETLGVELQYSILAEDPCFSINSTPITDELYRIAERLEYMENRLGDDDSNVRILKEYYSLLELRHWLLLKKSNDECNANHSFVFYFYSNAGDCPECEQQGFILTYLRKKYPHIRTYPFDINIDNPALYTIKSLFAIDDAPALVIDGQTFNRYMSKNELEALILDDVNSLNKSQNDDIGEPDDVEVVNRDSVAEIVEEIVMDIKNELNWESTDENTDEQHSSLLIKT